MLCASSSVGTCGAGLTCSVAGYCVSALDGDSCSDGNACTDDDFYIKGRCEGTPRTCAEGKGCDGSDGRCKSLDKLVGGACDDGDACTRGDVYTLDGSEIVCAGSTLECETGATCDPVAGICVNGSESVQECDEGLACDDGDPCTVFDTCLSGGQACAGTYSELLCPDEEVTVGGNGACVRYRDQSVECWGQNSYERYIEGDNFGATLPLEFAAPGKASGIAVGVGQVCRTSPNGSKIFCKGSPAESYEFDPVAMGNKQGSGFQCIVDAEHQLYCWGQNNAGQLGQGDTTFRDDPTLVTALPAPVHAVALGALHACALLEDGRLYCWGRNMNGQAVPGAGTDDVLTPTEVPSPGTAWANVDAGSWSTCGVSQSGTAYCWGMNRPTGAANNVTGYAGITEVSLSGVRRVAVGSYHSCGLTDAGRVYCWGGQTGGKLGDGQNTTNGFAPASAPVSAMRDATTALDRVREIAANDSTTCVIRREGGQSQPFCWGTNNSNQCGQAAAGSAVLFATETATAY